MSLASFVHRRLAASTSLLAIVACTEPNPYAMPATETTGATTGGGSTTGGLDASTTAMADATTQVASTDGSTGPTASEGSTGPAACTEACVPPVADGWNGPVAVRSDSPDAPMQDCPADYPLVADVAFAELSAPAFECDCDCAPPTDASCSSATLQRATDADCNPVTTTWNVPHNACVDIPGQLGGYWQVPPPEVDSGSCDVVPTVTPTDAAFAQRLTLCGLMAASPGVCGDGSTCAPVPADPLDGRICIWQDGEVACPADSPFADATVYHRDRDDTRGCADCSCGDPAGNCSGSVRLLSNNACDEFLWGNVPATGTCFMAINQTVQGVDYDETGVTAVCTPSDPMATGEVTPTDPVTLCCLTLPD